MWPGLEMPPSAMMGTPYGAAARATWYTAVACARPTAHTSCVVQMEPTPMPTRSPSAPAAMRRSACCFVTTLPPTTSTSGNSRLMNSIRSSWKCDAPWLESTTMTSTPSATSSRTRSRSARRVPTDAPTSSCLFRFLLASGCSWFFWMSRRLTSAVSSPLAFTIGSLPFFESRSVALACDSVHGSSAVTRSSMGVMISETGVVASSRKSVSRRLTKPSSLPPERPVSVTGNPEKPLRRTSASTSPMVASGSTQMGSVMKPFL
mmetsp:Transcript_4993/g.18051  ORF Transcript_4993/g.18051 Transcript_4993/m.18051 type:complete len:262 (+) Transcript_4993:551-1336(+)